ncbi:hypothetical protein DFQ27_008055 [Actinomortierella ambigua]|uniref:Uncharacterized protein n=1 Tax=Actinomortierella ambigua TaxID=1343610 RepID=A0A9P6QK01_9FUNG|nr:hypothetical protein DFQ27_008055 [Actinomortierella ambigua]
MSEAFKDEKAPVVDGFPDEKAPVVEGMQDEKAHVVNGMQDITQRDLLTEREIELLELEARMNAQLDEKLRTRPDKHPIAIYFILPNEFGERFCYHAIAPNMNKYFLQITGMTKIQAKVYTTAFTMLSYFFPVLGAALSDSYLGKWWTIIWFSVIYLIGMIMLTVFSIPNLLGKVGTVSYGLTFLPMIIIALGTGGIKPCVSSHGGDQYLPSQEKLKDRFFSLFYVAIQMGELITQFLVPVIADRPCMGQKTCYPYAFLLPTIVFLLSLAVFAIGHRFYRVVPPLGEFLPWRALKAAFLAGSRHYKASKEERAAMGHWLNFAEVEYGGVFMDDVRDFGLTLWLIVIPLSFWGMLYVQNNSEWADQYYQMSGALFGRDSKVLSSQFSNVEAILKIIMLPGLVYFVYPFFEKRGWNFSLTRRMSAGYVVMIISFAISAALNKPIEHGFLNAGRNPKDMADYDGTYCAECLSGWYQFPQWFLFALSGSMIWPSTVQFMYVETGRQFRAIATSFGLLMTSLGSIWITILDPALANAGMDTTARMWTYCGIGIAGWILFVAISWTYTPRKQRQPINQPAREAKETEYCLTTELPADL